MFVGPQVHRPADGARVAVQVGGALGIGNVAGVNAGRGAREPVVARGGVHEERIIGDAARPAQARAACILDCEAASIYVGVAVVIISEDNTVVQRARRIARHPVASAAAAGRVGADGAVVQRSTFIAIRSAAVVRGRVAVEQAVIERPATYEKHSAAFFVGRVAAERAVVQRPAVIATRPAAVPVCGTAGQQTIGHGPARIEQRAAARLVIPEIPRCPRVAVRQREAADNARWPQDRRTGPRPPLADRRRQ